MAIGDPREQFRGQDPRQDVRLSLGNQTGRGVVSTAPQTEAGVDGAMPAYLARFMEPYIQQKQTEAFFNGYMEQQAAGTEVEVIDDGGPIAKIWGPDGYREGASFYRGNKLVTDRIAGYMADLDELKKLPPEELSKKLAKDSQQLTTGNATTDAIVQKQLLSQVGPIINTIQKARIEWGQEEGVKTQHQAWTSAATQLQALSVAQARSTDAEAPETQAALLAQSQFAGMLSKPYGQTDESYKRGVTQSMLSMMRDGNFYAVEFMRKAGVTDMLNPEDLAKVETAYLSQGTKAVENARMLLMPKIMELQADVLLKENQAPNKLTARYMELNEAAAKITGVRDIELFDAKAIQSAGTNVLEMTRQTALRNEARLQAIQDKHDNWQHDEDMVKAKAAARLAAAQTAWADGHVNTALANQQVESPDMDELAQSAFNRGAMGELARPVILENWYSKRTADSIQANIKSSIPEGWNDTTKKAYTQWKELYTAGGSAAATYFGDYHTPMLALDSMMGQMPEEVAFARAFGFNQLSDKYQIGPEDRKVVAASIKDEIAKVNGGIIGIGSNNLTPSSKATIAKSIEGWVAMQSKYSNLDVKVLAKQAYDKQITNGSLEHYGKYAWTNPKDSIPFWKAVPGIQRDVFGKVLDEELNARMKEFGFSGTSAAEQYEIVRNGSQLTIVAIKDNGEAKYISITAQDLKNRQAKRVAGKVLGTTTAKPLNTFTGF